MSNHAPVTDWVFDFDHTDPRWTENPFPIWDELRAKCPVAHTERFLGCYLPTTFAAVKQISYDTEHFSSRRVVVRTVRPEPPYPSPPITSDPPEHKPAKQLLLPHFTPDAVKKLHIPAGNLGAGEIENQINNAITAKFSPGHPGAYVKLDYPVAWLDEDAFAAAHVRERDAEAAVGDAMKQAGLRGYYTKSQLAAGEVPNTELGRKYLNSYSPEGSWYVMGIPDIYTVGGLKGTDHASPYNYDTHVPLAFYGLPFRAGTYRSSVEPIDMAATLASLMGINAPTHSVGRVLTEALAPVHHAGESQP